MGIGRIPRRTHMIVDFVRDGGAQLHPVPDGGDLGGATVTQASPD
jgi:hypothetical protein